MKYTSEFYSINSTLYKIEIDVTNKSGSDKTFKLSESPFIASVSTDDKHLYTPIRCGGATVGILTESFIPDFYNGQSKGVKVTLINESANDKVEWVGYVTPSVYTQGFDDYLEQLELDCVDGIAVLKDIPYVPEGEDGEIKTFLEIITKCLKESGCYKYFYVSDNVQFTSGGFDSVITKLRVSENNFADDKEDPNQTIDDVAWSCYDVLYQIIQYLGYTLVVEGDEVFIIDYDAIKNGSNRYYRYSISTAGASISTTVTYSKYIDGKDYSSNGTNLEMTEIYNKVSVKDEFKNFDSIFPHYDDINYQKNITSPTETPSNFLGTYYFVDILYEERNGVRDYFYIIVAKCYKGKTMALMIRFYDNAIFEMKRYTQDRATIQDVSSSSIFNQLKYTDMQHYNGGYYYRYWSKEVGFTNYTKFRGAYKDNWSNDEKLKAWKNFVGETKFELQPITMFLNTGSYRINPGNGVYFNDKQTDPRNILSRNYPYMKLKDTMSNKIFGGKNAQLRITGSFLHHDECTTPFPISNGANNGSLKREGDTKDADEGWLFAKLKWGSYYWNGEEWTTSESYFKIYYWTTKISRDNRKNKNIFDRWFSFCDPNGSQDKPMEYVIPCPDGFNLQGQVEMEFYTRDMHGDSRRSHWSPKGSASDNRYCRYFSKVICLKDFDVIPEIVNDTINDGKGETDTIYTNVIQNGSINKMEEIVFKICTDDNKNPNFSSVDYLDDGGKSQYVTTLYNKALRTKENGSVGCDSKSDGALRQEEHYIFKLASQYESPRLVLECNLKNEGHKLYGTYTDKTLSGKTFIVGERDIDYKLNSVRLLLTEKF